MNIDVAAKNLQKHVYAMGELDAYLHGDRLITRCALPMQRKAKAVPEGAVFIGRYRTPVSLRQLRDDLRGLAS